ncbi:LLM class flavin-dependent oxidoreductase [Amorphus sp. 3PC139-8]|uniref:LLM class flavin-dependent oxidoreductase n=1 Tax=Amorphus sp. 3PC139-8 TaxID=2735676 RepID=UPI00345CBE29
MADKKKKMHLGMFLLPAGHHLSAWRLPGVEPAGWKDMGFLADIARTAERGKFDLIFLADADGLWQPDLEALSRDPGALFLEPFTLLSALAMVTDKIGLVASASTTYNAPFHVARKLASLDHISRGRAGWNIVTSFQTHIAANFGMDTQPLHADRYRVADEYVQLACELWDSWDDEALVCDKESGQYLDLNHLHVPEHTGETYSVKGPLNISRPPQGHPVLVQAGSSDAGKTLAAKFADIIFTVQTTLESAQSFYADVKARARAAGRDPDTVKVMPGIFPVIAETEEEADRTFEEMQRYVDPRNGLSMLAGYGFPIDMTKHDLDDPFPELPETEGQQWRRQVIMDLARKDDLTIRQVCRLVAVSRGHFFVKGTPETVANVMQDWLEGGAADGFNLMLPKMPSSLEGFVDKVVPELQKRGLFRTEYEGQMLRDHLGLARPAARRD